VLDRVRLFKEREDVVVSLGHAEFSSLICKVDLMSLFMYNTRFASRYARIGRARRLTKRVYDGEARDTVAASRILPQWHNLVHDGSNELARIVTALMMRWSMGSSLRTRYSVGSDGN
jgi:hypothetical protein